MADNNYGDIECSYIRVWVLRMGAFEMKKATLLGGYVTFLECLLVIEQSYNAFQRLEHNLPESVLRVILVF